MVTMTITASRVKRQNVDTFPTFLANYGGLHGELRHMYTIGANSNHVGAFDVRHKLKLVVDIEKRTFRKFTRAALCVHDRFHKS